MYNFFLPLVLNIDVYTLDGGGGSAVVTPVVVTVVVCECWFVVTGVFRKTPISPVSDKRTIICTVFLHN